MKISSLKGFVLHSISLKKDVTGFCGMLKFFVKVMTFCFGSFIIALILSFSSSTLTDIDRPGFDFLNFQI